MFNEYPYRNLSDTNLDLILNSIKKIRCDLDNFVNLNTIKYADPINWDITKQYESNTIVVDPYDGTAYISVRPIPVGVSISNTEYWTPIFNYGDAIENIKSNIASNELHSETATKAYTANSLVWFNDELYKTIVDMSAGTAFIINQNIVKCTVEDFIKLFDNALQTAINNEITARTDADTALQEAIDDEITARTNADTAMQEAIDDATTAINDEITARTDADNLINKRLTNISGSALTLAFLGRTYDVNYQLQGFCTDDQNNIISVLFNGVNKLKIEKRSFDGDVLISKILDSYTFQHGGDIKYKNNQYYMLDNNNIYILNSLLDIIDVKQFNLSTNNLFVNTFDFINDGYVSITINTITGSPSLTFFDGTLNETDNITINLNGDIDSKYFQSMTLHNNFIYWCTNVPDKILCIDLTGNVFNTIYINRYMSKYYPIAEIQDISFIDDMTFIIGGKPRAIQPQDDSALPLPYPYDYGIGIASYGIGRLDNNYDFIERYYYSGYDAFYNVSCKCDGATNVFKPLGTNAAPFMMPSEVMMCLQSPYYKPYGVEFGRYNYTEGLSIVNETSTTFFECSDSTFNGSLWLLNSDVTINNGNFSDLATINSRFVLSNVQIPENIKADFTRNSSGSAINTCAFMNTGNYHCDATSDVITHNSATMIGQYDHGRSTLTTTDLSRFKDVVKTYNHVTLVVKDSNIGYSDYVEVYPTTNQVRGFQLKSSGDFIYVQGSINIDDNTPAITNGRYKHISDQNVITAGTTNLTITGLIATNN